MPALALELEREARAPMPAPDELAPELQAPACDSCEGLAALPPGLRAGALTAMQRGEGNAAVARMLSRVAELPKPEPERAGERCKCGGTIGADGLCDKCRAERSAGIHEAAAGDGAIGRMLADELAAREQAPMLLRQVGPDAGGSTPAGSTRAQARARARPAAAASRPPARRPSAARSRSAPRRSSASRSGCRSSPRSARR